MNLGAYPDFVKYGVFDTNVELTKEFDSCLPLVALDPGEIVGAVSLGRGGHWEWWCFPCKGHEADAMWILGGMLGRAKTVIVEQFQLYPAMAQTFSWSRLYPVRIQGYLEFMAIGLGRLLVGQPASDKDQVSEDTLHTFWDKKRKLPVHVKDAAKHAIIYLLRKAKEAGK